MKTQNEVIKSLRATAKNNSMVFKKSAEIYNGKQCWCFFDAQGRASVSQGLSAWADDLFNGNVNFK